MIEQMDQRMETDMDLYAAAKLALQNLQQVKGKPSPFDSSLPDVKDTVFLLKT